MNESETTYVLDTSALLTLIEDEAGADVVQNIIESAGSDNVRILVSFMSFMKDIGKPCAGKPHARFDEGGLDPADHYSSE